MRRFTALAAVAAILTAGGAAVAGEKGAETPAAVKEKKICKGEAHSATRIAKKRICKTKAEWAQINGGSSDEGDRKPRARSRD
jgi:hypothetical protein